MSVFGNLLTGRDVEQDVLEHLQTWMGTYLAEVERQSGLAPLPPVRSWTSHNEFDKWPEEQIPCVLIVSPGLAGAPVKDGDGTYRASWSLGVAVIVSGASRDDTNHLAKLYSAAVRAILLQHPGLADDCRGVTWVDERYDDLPPEDGRTLAAGQNVFAIEYTNVLNSRLGPAAPSEDPEEWVLVDSHEIVLEAR